MRPPSICTTAAPRPIVAIVPLSLYLNGFVSLPAIRRAIVSPACSPDWSATEPSWGSTCSVFASMIAATSPSDVDLGVVGEREVGADADAVAALQLEPERLHERVPLQPGAPDERVRLELLAGLERDPGRARPTRPCAPVITSTSGR